MRREADLITEDERAQVLRDGLDQAARHRRLEAARGHVLRRHQDRRVQTRVSVHLRLGDPRPPALRGRLQQRHHPERESSPLKTALYGSIMADSKSRNVQARSCAMFGVADGKGVPLIQVLGIGCCFFSLFSLPSLTEIDHFVLSKFNHVLTHVFLFCIET